MSFVSQNLPEKPLLKVELELRAGGGGVPAGARVGVDVVPARGPVLAGAGEALVHVPPAVLAAEAGHAQALGLAGVS